MTQTQARYVGECDVCKVERTRYLSEPYDRYGDDCFSADCLELSCGAHNAVFMIRDDESGDA